MVKVLKGPPSDTELDELKQECNVAQALSGQPGVGHHFVNCAGITMVALPGSPGTLRPAIVMERAKGVPLEEIHSAAAGKPHASKGS